MLSNYGTSSGGMFHLDSKTNKVVIYTNDAYRNISLKINIVSGGPLSIIFNDPWNLLSGKQIDDPGSYDLNIIANQIFLEFNSDESRYFNGSLSPFDNVTGSYQLIDRGPYTETEAEIAEIHLFFLLDFLSKTLPTVIQLVILAITLLILYKLYKRMTN